MSFKTCLRTATSLWEYRQVCIAIQRGENLSEIVRAFLGIDIKEPELLSKIMNVQRKLNSDAAKMKLVEIENIHYTIRFLGDTPLEKIDEIKKHLERVKFDPFDIEVAGVGAFPNTYRPRIIWVGAKLNEEHITNLKLAIDKSLRELGYHLEKRKFTPHATIARVKYVKDAIHLSASLDELAESSIGMMTVSEVTMKKSTLTPTGAIYENLWHIPK